MSTVLNKLVRNLGRPLVALTNRFNSQHQSSLSTNLKKMDKVSQAPQLQHVIRSLKVKLKVLKFIDKLKSSRMKSRLPKDVQEEQQGLTQRTERFQIEHDVHQKKRQGFILKTEIKLLLSVLVYIAIIYIQVLSSFHFFLPQFRDEESGRAWVIATKIICLIIMICKMGRSFLTQRSVYGFKVIQLEDIVKRYASSWQFLFDALLTAAIILLLTNNTRIIAGGFAYFISLIRLIISVRIDQVISNHLILSNSRRQYLSLIRLLLTNLYLSHLVATVFLGLAQLRPVQNWETKYGIEGVGWSERYLYAIFWAVTTISTVGFGDITVANASETIFVILVMLFGCLVLSYNISQVASIFDQLKQKQDQLRKDLHTLRRVSHVNKLNVKLHQAIANYLVHASEVKFQQEMEQSRSLISKLPENLKLQYLEQSSSRFFSDMALLALFRSSTKKLIKQSLQFEILSPGQHITHKRFGIKQIYMLRMGTLGLAFEKKDAATLNGMILDHIIVNNIEEENPVLLNVFMMNRTKHLNYQIICQTFCNFAFIKFDRFDKCIREVDVDYEFMKQYYDSDSALQEEWTNKKCKECKQKHSIFNCPKLTYMPLRSHIYLRNVMKRYSRHDEVPSEKRSQHEECIKKFLLNMRQHKRKQAKVCPLKFWKKLFSPMEKVLEIKVEKMLACLIDIKPNDDSDNRRKKRNSLSHQIVREARTGLSNSEDKEFNVDFPYDFDYYFKKHNPNKLLGKEVYEKRIPKLIPRFSML